MVAWLVAGTVVLWLCARTWIEAGRGTLLLTHTDQVSIGTAVARQLNPALFTRDYAYHDLSLWTFYTPFPLWLARVLWSALGSYELALAVLVPVLLGAYVLGMYRLVLLVSGDRWVSLAVAMISAAPRYSIGSELWGIEGAQTVAPRALFWAASPWLFWFVFRRPARGWRIGLLIGLTLGLMANLHPVSALPMAEILTLLALVSASHWRSAVAEITGLVAGAVIGGLPTVLTFVTGLRGVPGAPAWISFEAFAQLTRERLLTIFPHKQLRYPLTDVLIGPSAQEIAVWAYVLFLVVIAVVAGRAVKVGRDTSMLWRVFMLGQLPIVYLLTGYSSGGLALVSVAAFYPFRWRLDDVDTLLVRLLAVTTSLVWLGSYALVRLWELTQSLSLTTLMAEHSRGARLVYVPLYLILARVSTRLLADDRHGVRGWGMVVAVWASVFATPQMPLGAIAVLTLAELARRDSFRRRSWWPLVCDGIVAGAIVWAVAHLFFSLRGATALLVIALVLIAVSRWLGSALRPGWGPLRYTAIALVLTAAVAGGLMWRTDVAGTPVGRMLIPRTYETLPPGGRDLLELSAWAREKTPGDALFFFGHPGPNLMRAIDAEFRFRAQRSITHAWKDIGIAYYVRGRLVAFHDRYHALARARRDPVTLLSCARALGTDYVVLSSDAALGMPIAYRNETYTVYRMSGQAAEASRPGRWAVPPECAHAR